MSKMHGDAIQNGIPTPDNPRDIKIEKPNILKHGDRIEKIDGEWYFEHEGVDIVKDITTEEAIERIHDLIHTCDVGIEKHGAYDDLFALDKQALEKILNELESEKEYHQWDLEKLQDYHKENSELNTKCVQLECQIEKKDKIIDAMTKYINNKTYRDDIECEFETVHDLKCPAEIAQIKRMSCKECIKQYFERKCKNE